jgi:glutamate 5-kinase
MSRLSGYRRIAVKVGSSLLIAPEGGLNGAWLDTVCADIAQLRENGTDVMVITSGAIALGRRLLRLPRGPMKLEESQAAAACGQISLAEAWSGALGRHSITAGQVLLTLDDTKARRRYLNARATINTLLKMRAVPVINENDTIATTEIRYGDNDRLAAHVATMMGADLLILLSDVDGLYSGPPALDPDARFIGHVAEITPEIEGMAGAAGTELSRGGMVTKIEAGRIATAGGTEMVITSGKKSHPVAALAGNGRATWFAASGNWVTARKKWISGQLGVKGALIVDEGALNALSNGKSLLPAGVRQAEGDFARGDVISVRAPDGAEIGRGIVAYDVGDARRILGRKSAEIAEILGYAGRTEMIHRDDLVMHAGTASRRKERVTKDHA